MNVLLEMVFCHASRLCFSPTSRQFLLKGTDSKKIRILFADPTMD